MFEDFDELFEKYFNNKKNKISTFDELFNEMFFNLNKSHSINEPINEDEIDLGQADKVIEITDENGTSLNKSI